MTTEIRIVISADAANAEKAIDAVDAGVGRLGAGGKKVDNFNKSLDETGRAARRTGAQMQNLSYQVTDIVTGLATGQNPFFVLLQQGGQLKDTFGGVLPALRALGSLFTVTRVLAGGAAAGLAAWAYAAYSGRDAARELEQYLRVSGNAALVTSSQYRASTAQIAESNNLTIGSVREVGEAVLRTGQFTRESYSAAVTAAAQFQKATGATTEETVKQFNGISKSVTSWAAEANKSYNFITAAQLEQIRSLEVQGRKQEAVRMAMELFGDTIKTRVEPNLNLLGRTVQSVGNFFSEMWEKAKGTFVAEGPEERLAAVQKALEEEEKALKDRLITQAQYDSGGARRDALRSEMRDLQARVRAQVEAKEKLASLQAGEQGKQDRNSDQFRAAAQANDQEGVTQRLAVLNLGLDRATSAYRQAYQEQLISAEGYQAALYAIDQQRLAGERASVAESIRIEQSRTPIDKSAQVAQQTKLLSLQTRLLEVDGKRAQLREDEQAGKRNQGFFETGADRITAAEDEAAQQRSKRQDELRKQRYDSADVAYAQLEAQTNKANAKALLTAEERGRAEIDEAVRVWREKIDVDSLYGQAQIDAEAMLNDFRVAEEARLTQRLRPEWQQRLLEWQDVNKLMRDASDETWNGVLRNAEDAFVQLVTTGKVSFEALVREFLITQAKMEFRRLVGGASGSLLGDLFKAGASLLGGGGVGGTTGYASVAGISGGRAMGGDVAAGGMYRINERGPGEIATVGGKDYLMMGANSGRVRPASQGRNVNISAPLTLYIDSRTDQAQIAQIAGAAVEQGRQRTFEELRAARVI